MNCQRCGRCCREEVCRIGMITYGHSTKPPCPALRTEGTISSCALVEIEDEFNLEPLIRESLGIGKGCCAMERVIVLGSGEQTTKGQQ